MNRERLHFVTGRLAESALRRELARLTKRFEFDYSIQVMPISVAALMTGAWIAKRITVPPDTTGIVLPGYASAGLAAVQDVCAVPVRLGPTDLRDLAVIFGADRQEAEIGPYDIEIIAEINHAPQQPLERLIETARRLVADGADVIDIGCDPEGGWGGIGECVAALRSLGIRVSVDSFDPAEVLSATRQGAELVLSVNSTNVAAASDWGVEVVVVPDDPADWIRMESTMQTLERDGVKFRIDPILEPAGIGLGASLARYVAARQRWPGAEMMMGTGNATELTDADSAAINLLLTGICQEQGIRSVLTTEVINWARTSVRECDIARRIAWYAVHNRVPAKRLSGELVIVRDTRRREHDQDFLQDLASRIRDRNYRIFGGEELLSVIGDEQLWQHRDPFELFDSMMESQSRTTSAAHAFYLGYELCKAELAAQLGKQYVQDEALDWGHLTRSVAARHRLKKCRRSADQPE